MVISRYNQFDCCCWCTPNDSANGSVLLSCPKLPVVFGPCHAMRADQFELNIRLFIPNHMYSKIVLCARTWIWVQEATAGASSQTPKPNDALRAIHSKSNLFSVPKSLCFFFYYYYYYYSRIRLYGFCSSDNDRVKDAVSAVAAGSTLDQFGTRFSVVLFCCCSSSFSTSTSCFILLLFLLLSHFSKVASTVNCCAQWAV